MLMWRRCFAKIAMHLESGGENEVSISLLMALRLGVQLEFSWLLSIFPSFFLLSSHIVNLCVLIRGSPL